MIFRLYEFTNHTSKYYTEKSGKTVHPAASLLGLINLFLSTAYMPADICRWSYLRYPVAMSSYDLRLPLTSHVQTACQRMAGQIGRAHV